MVDAGTCEGDAGVDSGTCGGDGGEPGVGGLRGTDGTVELGEDRDDTETGSSEGGSGKRKDRETEGAGSVVEDGDA